MTGLRQTAARTLAAAVAGGLLAWAFGVNSAQSTLLALVVVAAGAGHALCRVAVDVAWTDRISYGRHGTRREVSRLGSSLTGRERAVSAASVHRLGDLAERRLRRLGLDPFDPAQRPAVERTIGARAHQLLFAPDAEPDAPSAPVAYAAFVACIDAVERLEDHHV